MRITIDIDEREIESTPKATAALAISIPEAVDAGTASSDAIADISAEDTGGPPAWLLEAVDQATKAEDLTSAAESDFEDAGAGPA